jgi:hypothetical protein
MASFSFRSNSLASSCGDNDGRQTRSQSVMSTCSDGPRKSLRMIKYCTELLPRNLMCNGCTLYEDLKPTLKKQPRAVSHSGDFSKYTCVKPWTKTKDKAGYYDLDPKVNNWFQKVHQYLADQGYAGSRRLLDIPSEAFQEDVVEALSFVSDLSPLTNESSTTTTSPLLQTRFDNTGKVDSREDIQLYSETVLSMGEHQFKITGIPITHSVVTKSHLQKLNNSHKTLKHLQNLLQRKKFYGGSSLTKAIIATAVTSCPALPLSQAANIIPQIVAATLLDAGVLDKAKVAMFSKSFASEAWLRNRVFMFAAENMYQLGIKIKNIQVFLSCDKGNKKGVGHFVKILSWYDKQTKSVVKQLLDIDGSDGKTSECADAIAASLKKIGDIKIQGQTTDSGGGGVLVGLANALQEKNLCRPRYLFTSCSLHNLQLSVANPIKEVIGEGGLEKKNAMQLLHSVYDLQASMPLEVWKTQVDNAVDFLQSYGGPNTPYIGITNGDRQFADKWEKAKTFRTFTATMTDKELRKIKCTIQAPVLTRWWTVGECAQVVWPAYLLLLRICQQVINSHPTSAKPNKIASGLQPLMLEAEIFTDLSMIHCFHSFYVSPHFDWMQSATDLTALPGFQAHNTLGRYFLLVQDLNDCLVHPLFEEFRQTMARLPPSLQQHQESKAKLFIETSLKAINKHFERWGDKSLLPAALLSEVPLASVIAAVVLKQDTPQEVLHADDFVSKAHYQRSFNILKFDAFVRSKLTADNDEQYYPLVRMAAEELLKGQIDLRDMDNEDPVTAPISNFLYHMYLPLASHTQFVEAGVKEAKNVSTTDRSEMLRSAYAVCRAARLHCIDDLRCLSSTNRIEALLSSAIHHCEDHEALKALDEEYDARIEDIADLMRENHFRHERVENEKQEALNKANKNKVENAMQKRTGVEQTAAVAGIVRYGNLRVHHLDAIKVELLARGCTEEEVSAMKNLTAFKNKLKEMELARVIDNGGDALQKQQAANGFKPLSEALFPVS